MLSATATMTAVEGKPAYQADLARARAEIAALRARGAQPQGCAAEANLVNQRVMPRLDSAW
jgi:acid phosphatase (class A)